MLRVNSKRSFADEKRAFLQKIEEIAKIPGNKEYIEKKIAEFNESVANPKDSECKLSDLTRIKSDAPFANFVLSKREGNDKLTKTISPFRGVKYSTSISTIELLDNCKFSRSDQ